MTFRMSAKPLEVMWPITVQKPANGGKTIEQKFSIKWKVLDTTEFEKMMPTAMDFSDDRDIEPWVTLWSKIITGFQDIKGEKGEKAWPVTLENIKSLVRVPYVQCELLGTYRECITGRKVKN